MHEYTTVDAATKARRACEQATRDLRTAPVSGFPPPTDCTMTFYCVEDFVCYYGPGRLPELATFDLAILQPAHYTRPEVEHLQRTGCLCLAYLSLGELPELEATPSWRLVDPLTGQSARNPRWNTLYLDCRLAAWQDEVVQRRVPAILERGFAGLFLDTLDVQEIHPATRPGVVQLVQRLHTSFPTLFLAANRGFSLLPQINQALDAVVFEAFTTHCRDGSYAAWTGPDLLWTEGKAAELRAICGDRPILALDYAAPEDDMLQRLAKKRAAGHGFVSFVTTCHLDTLPARAASGR